MVHHPILLLLCAHGWTTTGWDDMDFSGGLQKVQISLLTYFPSTLYLELQQTGKQLENSTGLSLISKEKGTSLIIQIISHQSDGHDRQHLSFCKMTSWGKKKKTAQEL